MYVCGGGGGVWELVTKLLCCIDHCVCIYVCMYVCMCVCVSALIIVCVSVYACLYTYERERESQHYYSQHTSFRITLLSI
jgi:hypothetical protein